MLKSWEAKRTAGSQTKETGTNGMKGRWVGEGKNEEQDAEMVLRYKTKEDQEITYETAWAEN